MSYLNKIATTLGVAAAAAVVGTVSASADSVTVQSGDTLNKIAQAHGTDADTLASINHLQNKNLIYVGDVIETTSTSTAAAATTTAQTDTTTATQTQTQASATQTYTPTTEYTAPAATTTQAAPQTATASTTGNSDALNSLINRESSGNVNATNGDYYGIGQLSSQARANYGGNSTDYNDQLNAMKSYISARYGTAEAAWAHSQATGWY